MLSTTKFELYNLVVIYITIGVIYQLAVIIIYRFRLVLKFRGDRLFAYEPVVIPYNYLVLIDR
jgi:hypothetical protein